MSQANATGRNDPDNEQDQHQGQAQGQQQGQGQLQGQHQDANASADNAGNMQTLNVNSTTPDDITIRNTAAARIPNVNATSPCYYGWSGGLGIAGANIGGGKQKLDHECNIRETARTFAALGEIGQALIIACSSEAAKAALGDACGLSPGNVYVRVNEPVRYVERVTGALEATHDVSEEAVETCTESTNRAFKQCASK